MALTGHFGRDEVPYAGRILSLIDFIGTYNVSSTLTLTLNADFRPSSGSGLKWRRSHHAYQRLAGYANDAIADALRISVRAEYLSYLRYGHALEGTVALGYTPIRNFEVRAEQRYEKLSNGLASAGAFYVRADPDTENQIDADHTTEFALQGVYEFSLP